MTARAQASGSGTRKPFGPIGWAEQGLVPDRVIRAGIRRLNRRRLEDIRAQDVAAAAERLNGFAEAMQSAPIAPVPELANEQHYEVPAEFFAEVMGRHRKYSCCHWDANTRTLDDAEASALEISCDRAGIADGMAILDLGCGWGSLSLWIAAEYPQCRIVAVSNSASQRAYIASTAHRRGLENIEVLTSDMNDFDTEQRFDRVVSVEMFEHMPATATAPTSSSTMAPPTG
jgi:cyclopropane-fatty-acyl-phospholipid synthase